MRFFPIILLLPLSLVHIISSEFCSQTRSVYLSLTVCKGKGVPVL
jgi:hypothetical protein